jgi:hypothetical protein
MRTEIQRHFLARTETMKWATHPFVPAAQEFATGAIDSS